MLSIELFIKILNVIFSNLMSNYKIHYVYLKFELLIQSFCVVKSFIYSYKANRLHFGI